MSKGIIKAEYYNKDDSLKHYKCYYCSDIALGVDHRPPISWLQFFDMRHRWMVRCCNRCNSQLRDRPFTLEQAEQFLLNYWKQKR